jgi:hypothetical protein
MDALSGALLALDVTDRLHFTPPGAPPASPARP